MSSVVTLSTIKARALQEAPSFILCCYFGDKIYFTWPLLPSKSTEKLLNLLLSFYRRRQEKIRLGLKALRKSSYSLHHIYQFHDVCFFSFFFFFYLSSCLFSKLLSQRRKLISFCSCYTMRSFYAMNLPVKMVLTTSHEF